MKYTILSFLISMLIQTASAQASYLQEYCGNAQGTVRTAMGHSANHVTLTERKFIDDKLTDVKVEVQPHTVTIEPSPSTVLSSEGSSSCKPGDQWGSFKFRNFSAKKLRITHVDGTTFNESTLGLTPDRMAVEDTFICDFHGSSSGPCENP